MAQMDKPTMNFQISGDTFCVREWKLSQKVQAIEKTSMEKWSLHVIPQDYPYLGRTNKTSWSVKLKE
jgi:hypothetical protein